MSKKNKQNSSLFVKKFKKDASLNKKSALSDKSSKKTEEDSKMSAQDKKPSISKKANESLKEKMKLKNPEPTAEEKLKVALKENLYLRAEFENFKKRSYEEMRKLHRYAGETFISSLADEVLDDLERALESAQKENSFENLKKGLELIQKKISQVLESFGVQVVDPKGKAFDPSYQEALSHIKTSNVPEGHVAETFKKAYKLHDKVIRPAQVILAKGKD